jgi:hypothetical protein
MIQFIANLYLVLLVNTDGSAACKHIAIPLRTANTTGCAEMNAGVNTAAPTVAHKVTRIGSHFVKLFIVISPFLTTA